MVLDAYRDAAFDSSKHMSSVKSEGDGVEESAVPKTSDETTDTKQYENALNSNSSSPVKEASDVDSHGLIGDQKSNKKDTSKSLREKCFGIFELLLTAMGLGLGLCSSITTHPIQAESMCIVSDQQGLGKSKNENPKLVVCEIDGEVIKQLEKMTEADISNRAFPEAKGSYINESFSLTKRELLDSLSGLERVVFVYKDYKDEDSGEDEDLANTMDVEKDKEERRRREGELQENNTTQPLA